MISNAFWQPRSCNLKDVYISLIAVIITVIIWYHLVFKKPKKNPPLPPGPWGLPLVGNIFSLDQFNLHKCLAKLSETYGPIMKIRLGTRLCIVINSATIAKEVHKDHDYIFANRDITATASAVSWGGTDIIWSPHGDHWRMLRKICVKDLLNSTRLDALYDHRCREIRSMVNTIYSKTFNSIDIGDHIFRTMYNVMANMMWGGTPEGREMANFTEKFRDALEKIVPILLAPNISDIFPVLAKFDIQGLAQQARMMCIWFHSEFDTVIDQRLGNPDKKEMKDFLQVLLHLKDDGDLKRHFTTTDIKTLLLNLLAAGTKSSAATVEWAMTELLREPKFMKKAQEEIDEVVGMNNILEEAHCSKLHYLNAVVKETLRLHPGAPLSFPKCPSESCTVSGYTIPKGTKILVNIWAIQRDITYWKNPLEFQPDRFLGSDCEWGYNGKNTNYMPFGSGRRICAGIPLAERMVPYLLASLLHSFNWKLPEGTKIDLSDTFGLELKKTTPLIAIPLPRLSDKTLYI